MPFRGITTDALQRYVEERSQETGQKGKPVSHTTIQKEIGMLASIWNKWALPQRLVTGPAPTRGLTSAPANGGCGVRSPLTSRGRRSPKRWRCQPTTRDGPKSVSLSFGWKRAVGGLPAAQIRQQASAVTVTAGAFLGLLVLGVNTPRSMELERPGRLVRQNATNAAGHF
jgi:hypothetical protein